MAALFFSAVSAAAHICMVTSDLRKKSCNNFQTFIALLYSTEAHLQFS